MYGTIGQAHPPIVVFVHPTNGPTTRIITRGQAQRILELEKEVGTSQAVKNVLGRQVHFASQMRGEKCLKPIMDIDSWVPPEKDVTSVDERILISLLNDFGLRSHQLPEIIQDFGLEVMVKNKTSREYFLNLQQSGMGNRHFIPEPDNPIPKYVFYAERSTFDGYLVAWDWEQVLNELDGYWEQVRRTIVLRLEENIKSKSAGTTKDLL